MSTEGSITTQTGKRLDRMIMVVLVLALAYFAFDNFVLDPQREAERAAQQEAELEKARQTGQSEALVESYGDKSIAVLAFDDMSPEGDQEYLSDGIAEELLNLLAGIRELRVISRSSAFSFKGKDVPMPDIARQLNVAHILEGSVRKAGNRIRITAQLIEARSDTHLWSQTYDRDLGDIFAIQDDIAGAIVEQLKMALVGPMPSPSQTDPETYDLYLRALQANHARTLERRADALELLQRALVLDPAYAPAWALLGWVYLGDAYFKPVPYEESVPLARKAAETALEHDPANGQAHLLLVFIALMADRDWQAAARHAEAALASGGLDPQTFRSAITVAYSLGRQELVMDLAAYAIARDPLYAEHHRQLGINYLFAGRPEEALASFQDALSLDPEVFQVRAYMAYFLGMEGRYEEALSMVSREPWEGARLQLTSWIYHEMGDEQKSDEALDALLQLPTHEAGYGAFSVYTFRGQNEAALDWLEQNISQMNFGVLSGLNYFPMFEGIRRDPRFQEMMDQAGVSREKLDEIEFNPDFPR